jgi:inosose dehydratase
MLNKDDVKIGCSPISWISDDEPNLGGGSITWLQTLDEIVLAGYDGFEMGSTYPWDAEKLKYECNLRGGIQLCNAWMNLRFTSRPLEETLQRFTNHRDFLHAMGASVIGCGECGVTTHLIDDIPLYTNPPVLNDQQFKNLINGLNRCGKLASEKGMAFGIHPHMGTGIQTAAEIERVLNETDPEYVGLVLDTGHTAAAGEDPVSQLEKHIDRVRLLHIKDCNSSVIKKMKEGKLSFLAGVREGLFAVPGDGDLVNWNEIFSVLDKYNYKGWIVVEAEQDPTKKNPLEYTKKARTYIKQKIGF